MPRPIKILHCLGTLDPGGVETWLTQVIKAIDTQRFQFDFCTFGPHAGLFAPEVEKIGARVLRCPLSKNVWKFGTRFRRILRQGQYDVVHSHVHFFSGAILRWAQAEKVPVRIAHSHTIDNDRPDRWLRRYYRRLMQSWIRKHATHGLAISQIAGKELFGEAWQHDRRFEVLHYGIDLSLFQSEFNKDQIRRELRIPVNVPVVGHVGRFVKAKNHHFLLKIAADVLKMRPDIHFLFVGDGPLKAEIEEQSRSMGISRNVHFQGTRSDVPRLMQGCMDAFVFPSRWEGFGLVLIEAQAAGLPCVVSDSVSDETSIFRQRIFRLPLSKSTKEWAIVIIKSLELTPLRSEETLSALAQTGFCIRQSSTLLTQVYAGINHVAANEVEGHFEPSTNRKLLGPSVE